jgi:thiol-disulfide isomerase/thioredoxin
MSPSNAFRFRRHLGEENEDAQVRLLLLHLIRVKANSERAQRIYLGNNTGMRTLAPLLFVAALLTISAYADQTAVKAPNFGSDAQWIDTGEAGKKVPHSIKGYRGQVLLIDFWEYTCINCIRDFSVLKRWYGKYHGYGLDIVGVHFGEFQMGYNADNVRDAAKRFQLPWPVVADLQGTIWRAYHSDVWPNRYLIDQNGDIILHLEGEGRDRPMEEKIRELLAKTHPEVNQLPLDPPEMTFAPACGISTDETYVGDWFGRGAIANAKGYKNDGEVTDFHAEGAPADGKVMFSGRWTTQQDGVTSAEKHGEAQLRYHARSVYAVLSVENPKKPVRVDLLQDGKPVDPSDAGIDVRIDSQGSYLEVSSPRMYYLVKNSAFGSPRLALEPEAPDFALHSFTYGNDCQQDFEQK